MLHDGQEDAEAIVLHNGRAYRRVQLLGVGEVHRLFIAVRVLDLRSSNVAKIDGRRFQGAVGIRDL